MDVRGEKFEVYIEDKDLVVELKKLSSADLSKFMELLIADKFFEIKQLELNAVRDSLNRRIYEYVSKD